MACVWDFRANLDYYQLDELREWMRLYCKKYTFQSEKGDTGYEHWQGRFSLSKKRTKAVLMELWEPLKVPNYLEPTATKNHTKEHFYAMKTDTRIEGPWTDTDDEVEKEKQVYLPRQFQNITLYPWQERVLQTGNEFDSRTINLIYDPCGNSGKSTVASIGEILHGGIDMPPLNDFKELVALACDICYDRKLRNPAIFFFDMPRAVDKSRLYGLYSAIEQVKKGKLYDCRYKYKCWWIDSPAVWVFSNMLPDLNMLSADRWKIWTINSDKVLVPYEEQISALDL